MAEINQAPQAASNTRTAIKTLSSYDDYAYENPPVDEGKPAYYVAGQYVSGLSLPIPVESSKTIPSQSTTFFKGNKVELNINSFKEHILDTNNCASVIPALAIFCGLPASFKSTALNKVFADYVHKLETQSALSAASANQGILEYNIAGLGLKRTQGWYWAEVNDSTAYNFPTICALTQGSRTSYQLVQVQNSNERVFQNDIFDDHIHVTYESLCNQKIITRVEKKHIPKISEDEIPQGLSMLRIWDIGFNKAVYHSLSAINGLLDHCYPYIFFNLERDADELNEFPDFSDERIKGNPDTKLQMQWRPRLYYLFRQALLAKSRKKTRKRVCLIVAAHKGLSRELASQKIEKFKRFTKLAAKQVGVEELLVPDVVELNVNDEHSIGRFKQRLEQVLMSHKSASVDIPLSWIFLRSTLHSRRQMWYIPKITLQGYAKELNIEGEDFENFLSTFTSFGSLIYDQQNGVLSETVILQPITFIRKVEKLFYPEKSFTSITNDGIISQSTAKEILDEDDPLTMNVLASIKMAVKLEPDQIEKPNNDDSCYYYVPHIRSTQPSNVCSPNCLHILFGLDTAPVNTQVAFVASILQCLSKDVKLLPFTNLNITKFRFTDNTSSESVEFECVYHGDAIEVNLPPSAKLPESFYKRIIEACKETVRIRSCSKYAFTVTCVKNESLRKPPCGKAKVRHYLPDDKLCAECWDELEEKKLKEHLEKWNEVIKKSNIPEDKLLLKDAIRLEEMIEIAETVVYEQTSKSRTKLIGSLADKLGTQEYYVKMKSTKDTHKLVLVMLLVWENNHITSEDRKQPARTRLCEILLKLELNELARRLDMWTSLPVKSSN